MSGGWQAARHILKDLGNDWLSLYEHVRLHYALRRSRATGA
jgi:hypothetical protein